MASARRNPMTLLRSLFDRARTIVGTTLLGRPPADEQTSAIFEAEGLSRCRRGARTLCLLAIALFAASVIVSAATPTEQSFLLMQIRLGAILTLAAILWLLRTSYGHRYPRELFLLTVVALAITLESLAFYTGGQASNEQYNINFLILAAAMFASWSAAWPVLTSLTVVGLHVLVTVATEHSIESPQSLHNLGLLIASSGTALVITVARERLRWQDLCRRQAFASVQREVIEREQRYHSLVETASSAIILVAPDNRILELNREMERVLGRHREDVLGEDAFELILPEKLRDGAAAEAKKVLAGESIRGREASILTADGSKRIFLWNVSCFQDSEGRPAGIIAVGQDITKRRQAELEVRRLNTELEQRVVERTAELQESEKRFRAIFESSPLGMIIADGARPGIVRTNQALQKLMGYSDSEFRGIDMIDDLTHPDDVEKSKDAFGKLLDGRTGSYHLEKRYVRRDGSVVWSDTRVFAVRDVKGEIRYAFALVQDITERKQKQTLQEAEMRALALLAERASLGEALTVLIEALEELESGTLCSIMLTDEQGKHLHHVAAPRLPDDYRQALDGVEIDPEVGSHGASAHRRTCVLTEDIGVDPLWAGLRELALRHGIAACWSFPIVSPSGRLLGTVAMHHRQPCRPTDAQAGLMNAAVYVAAIIIERKLDADLIRRHQIQMAHAGRVSLVGELAASLAHDLHQPLAAIANYASGCVRRINGGTRDPDQLVYPMEQIRLLALQAGEIIRDLRGLIRKSEGGQERVDLNELVRRAARLAEPEARHHGITLRLDLEARIPPVDVDSVQIEQVVLNLLSNGIEAMTDDHTDGRELVVRSSMGRDGRVVLAVSDCGESLSPSSIERVFEPFYTTKTHGLGMGLAISRSIVEAQGGRMRAMANPGRGMTFQFTLPVPSEPASNRGDGEDARGR